MAGKVSTGHHDVSLRVKSLLDSIEDEAAQGGAAEEGNSQELGDAITGLDLNSLEGADPAEGAKAPEAAVDESGGLPDVAGQLEALAAEDDSGCWEARPAPAAQSQSPVGRHQARVPGGACDATSDHEVIPRYVPDRRSCCMATC